MGRALIDRTGQRFGRLVVVSRAPSIRERGGGLITCWTCRCDCGETHTVRGPCLFRGNTRSCGCLKREQARSTIAAARAARRTG